MLTENRGKKGAEKSGYPMKIRAIKVGGQIIAFEAFAGKLSGRKMRKRFRVSLFKSPEDAQKAALAWAKAKAAQIIKQRAFGAVLDERTLLQVAQAVEILSPYNVSLIDCVREWALERERPKNGQAAWTFAEGAKRLLKERKDHGAAPQYLHHLGGQLNAFSEVFGSQSLSEITTEAIEHWLDHRRTKNYKKLISPATRTNWRRDLGMVWRFAMLRGFANHNPATLLGRAKRNETDVSFLPVETVERLFQDAKKTKSLEVREVLTFSALALFAGLRTSEILRLDWSLINLQTNLIEIRAKGRTRRRRLVSIPANLKAWLEFFSVAQGLVITIKPRRIRTTLKMLTSDVSLAKNVLRHSWFSYHLALHENQALTQHEGGHASADILFRHYRALVTKEAATRFFSVSP